MSAASKGKITAERLKSAMGSVLPEPGQIIHVISQRGGWAVLREGSKRALKNFDRRADAIERARSLAQSIGDDGSAEVVVHHEDGTIDWDQSELSETP